MIRWAMPTCLVLSSTRLRSRRLVAKPHASPDGSRGPVRKPRLIQINADARQPDILPLATQPPAVGDDNLLPDSPPWASPGGFFSSSGRQVYAMKAAKHEWADHGRWRECVRCGQRQYKATAEKRGSQSLASRVPTVWLPDAEPCVPQDDPEQS